MPHPRLLVFDLDGTLLPESKRLTERTREALTAMQELGSLVTLATGKFLHLARRYGEELELTTPLIALDGARVGGGNGDSFTDRCIPQETAEEILERYDDPTWSAFADDGADQMLLRSRHPGLETALSPWASAFRHVELLADGLVGSPAIVSFYGPEGDIERLHREIAERYTGLRIFRFFSEQMNSTRLSLQPHGVSKGSGLRGLLDTLQLEAQDCIVFGDWHNDLPLFEVGAFNVAMANAVEELKERADEVLEQTSDEDGVARFLESRFL